MLLLPLLWVTMADTGHSALGAETLSFAAGVSPISTDELRRYVDQIVSEYLRRDHIAGSAVSVVQANRAVLEQGYGIARSGGPNLVQAGGTLFHIGSLTKTFTWIVVMKAVERGELTLDAPINLYLPDAMKIADQGFKRQITMLDLMSHTAGFYDPEAGLILQTDPAKVRPLAEFLRNKQPARFQEPGRFSAYSDYGASLAGYVAARLADTDYETLIELEILRPLSMFHTTVRDARPPRPGMPAPTPLPLALAESAGFLWDGARLKTIPVEFAGSTAPSGAGWTTASDMSHYMVMLLQNGQFNRMRIFDPRTARAFRTAILAMGPGINGWAHGFIEYNVPGGRTGYGHDGNTIAFCSNMLLVPELDIGVFVTANTNTGADLCEELPGRIIQHFYEGTTQFASPKTIAPDPMQLAKYSGYYNATRRAPFGIEDFFDVSNPRRVQVTDQGLRAMSRTWLPTTDVTLFVEKGGVGRLSFDFEHGVPIRWRTESNTTQFERTAFWADRRWVVWGFVVTAFAAALVIVSGVFPVKRTETRVQRILRFFQIGIATLWLLAIACYYLFLPQVDDSFAMMFGWPAPLMLAFSWLALASTALSLLQLAGLPLIWNSGTAPPWRKAHFTLTAILFVTFGVMLAARGALGPLT
jgi:CubicO group peptidase (beta-lactamase class C family)